MKSMVVLLLALLITMPALAQPLAEGDHLIRIRLWTGEGVAKQLAAIAGRQSRDIGGQLRQAAKEGKLKPLAGKYDFRVGFRNLANPAPGTMVMVNGQPVPFANPTDITVINGEGRMQISSRWVDENTILVLTYPPELGEMHYPPPPYRQLRTARGELARLVREHEVSNYHFVK